MFLFKSRKHKDGAGALHISAEGIASVVLRQQKQGEPELVHCAFHTAAPGQTEADLLKRAVTLSGVDKTRLSVLLNTDDYQLLMVEAPEVPAQELKAAIRWRIRDLIDFHIDDAVLDVFDVPPSGARGIQEHLYTVVSRSALVQEKIDRLEQAGAEPEIIDIPELVLRNIASQLDKDESGQATLYFGPSSGLITLTRNATLYLARNLDIGYEQIRDNPAFIDRLALELQRSVDYYDRHFQQAPINQITLCPPPVEIPALAERIEEQTGIPTHVLQLSEFVSSSASVDHETFARCLLAIGAALRQETREL